MAIVGSGIGALSNAVCLSRQGFKVAVFEQNETVGGCTHTFEKEGYEFDVGVHYVGECMLLNVLYHFVFFVYGTAFVII